MSLNSIHPSVMSVRRNTVDRLRPKSMDVMYMTVEQRQLLEQVALDIFTDMSNAACTFPQILASIYLSGAKHMAAIQAQANETK